MKTNTMPAPEAPVVPPVSRRIAIALQGGKFARHFGQAETFAIYHISGSGVCGGPVFRVRSGTCRDHGCGCREGGGAHHSILAVLEGCEIVLCGGIGRPVAEALRARGIAPLVTDAEGEPEEICRAYLAGELRASAEPTCAGH
jgi:predicted Fe-Mo cluster-binding NifX family protein